MNPKDTLQILDLIHSHYSKKTRKLIHAYAERKESKAERDQAEAAEEVLFIFARAVQRQIR